MAFLKELLSATGGERDSSPKVYRWGHFAKQSTSPEQPEVSFCVISDTHGLLLEDLPAADVLIHCGDATHKEYWGKSSEHGWKKTQMFFDWLRQQDQFTHKVLIAGNHEYGWASPEGKQRVLAMSQRANSHYLQDDGVTLHGLRFYGTPWTTSKRMSFSCARGDAIAQKWAQIPTDCDVLITHMPPHNVLDLAWSSRAGGSDKRCTECHRTHPSHRHWGNRELRARVAQVKPRVHLFGHVHDEPGHQLVDGVHCINAAVAENSTPHLFSL